MKQDDQQTTNADGSKNDTQHEGNDPDAITTSPKEIGGPRGPEPTRYGDWERKGRCIDF